MTPRGLVGLVLALFLLTPGNASAHKPSDAYLTLILAGDTIAGQWDIALRDLDFRLGLDLDGDGTIRWGEVKSRRDAIVGYAFDRLHLTAEGKACAIQQGPLLIDRHSDGAYAVLKFTATCDGAPRLLAIDYSLFAEIDPQHRGLVRITAEGTDRAAVLGAGRPRELFAIGDWGKGEQFLEFVKTGIGHIWSGYDHMLFLISLLLPAVLVHGAHKWRPQEDLRAALWDSLKIVSAFTLAHSITLSLSILGVVSVPARISESAIALSVAVAAINNLHPVVERRLWIAAFFFGLVHGFGFANSLAELGLGRDSLLISLVGFNLGVEIGQAAIVAVFLPLAWRMRESAFYRQAVFQGGSALILAIASYWFVQRAFDLDLNFS